MKCNCEGGSSPGHRPGALPLCPRRSEWLRFDDELPREPVVLWCDLVGVRFARFSFEFMPCRYSSVGMPQRCVFSLRLQAKKKASCGMRRTRGCVAIQDSEWMPLCVTESLQFQVFNVIFKSGSGFLPSKFWLKTCIFASSLEHTKQQVA